MSDRTPVSPTRYYAAHGGKSLLWAGEDMLGLFVLIQLLGIDALVAGVVFMISSFLNAGMDLIAGRVFGQPHRATSKLAWLVGGAILLASAAFALLLWLPTDAVILAGAVLILARLSHSLLDVAHNALSTEVARSEGDLRMAQRRAILASATSLLIGLMAIPLRSMSDDTMVPAMLITFVAVLAFVGLAPLPELVRKAGASPRREQSPCRRMPRAIFLLCIATLIGMVGLGALAKCLVHLQFPWPWIGPAAMFIYMIARLMAVWFWEPLAIRLGNRSALGGAFAFAGFSAVALPVLATTASGSVLAIALLGIAGGGCAMLCWAALTELTKASGEVVGMSQAWIYGTFTMSAKIGLGLSGLAVGTWLKAAPLTNGSLTQSSNLWGIAVASDFCCLVSAALLTGSYPGFLIKRRAH